MHMNTILYTTLYFIIMLYVVFMFDSGVLTVVIMTMCFIYCNATICIQSGVCLGVQLQCQNLEMQLYIILSNSVAAVINIDIPCIMHYATDNSITNHNSCHAHHWLTFDLHNKKTTFPGLESKL